MNRDGSCDLNILIRTITAQGGLFKFRAGAGIVADSNPAQELAETRAKAEGLLRALASPLNAWINGRQGTRIDIRDRGLQYGDGVFETLRIRRGRVRLLEYHFERLALGCQRLGIAGPSSRLLRREINSIAGRRREGVLKLIVTRGAGRRGYAADGPRTLHAHPHRASVAAWSAEARRDAGAAAPLHDAAGLESAACRPQDPESPGIGAGP